jgi:hypothetical protein
VPNIAAIIWTTNRIPTALATALLDIGAFVLDTGTVMVLMLVMACPSDCVRSGPRTRF